jgi:hypothetical protein
MYKATIVLFMTGFLFLSCNQNKTSENTESASKQKTVSQNELQDTVLLSTATDVFKLSSVPDTLNVKMTNHTGDTLTTGLHYDIQKLENSEWIKVLPDQFFQDIGFGLLPSESKSFTVRMRKDQAVYKAGNYRVVKYYLKQDFKKTRKQFFVYAEFRIE